MKSNIDIDIDKILEEYGFNRDSHSGVWFPENIENFAYNDGDAAENYILEVIQNTLDLSVNSDELASKMIDWPSIYHLSPRRANLLRPFKNEFKNKRILEIGCGCGAITRFLGESGANVLSVEGSPRRAKIAKSRCRDLSNVEVICNPADKLPDLGEFDIVLLIGVLEYARIFVGKNGENTLLAECFNRLKSDGTVYVAIENKLGIKYFAGAHEDHVNLPMYGINNSYTDETVVTFGRQELKQKLSDAGFVNTHEYLPLPDYKLPTSVVTPLGWKSYQQKLCQLAVESIHKDPQLAFEHLFSAEQGTRNIWNNALAEDLSNSFLMVAHKEEKELALEKIAAIHYSDTRLSAFRKTVEFIVQHENKLVVKTLRDEDFNSEIDEEQTGSITDFYDGMSMWFVLANIINRPEWRLDEVGSWTKDWIEKLLKSAELPLDFNNDLVLPDTFQDALPFNVISSNEGRHNFFDLEWKNKSPKLGYIAFRGVFHSLLRITSLSHSSDCNTSNISYITFEVLKRAGFEINERIYDDYLHQEAEFLSHVQLEDENRIYETLKSLNLVFRARKLISVEHLDHANAEIAMLNNEITSLKSNSENSLGELALELYEKNRTLKLHENRLELLSGKICELEKVNQELIHCTSHQQHLLNQYSNDINAILTSASWKMTSPIRTIGRRLPDKIKKPLRRLLSYSFKILQPVKIKIGHANRRFFEYKSHNGLQNTLKKSARKIAKKAYYKLPIEKRSKALSLAMKLYPQGFVYHPAYSAIINNTDVTNRNLISTPVYINYEHQNGYRFDSIPNQYVYIPTQKPFYYDDILDRLEKKPKFSIVVPIYNTPLDLLELMVGSVKNQWYQNWELILANDASPLPEIVPALKKIAEAEPRVKIIHLNENKGIAGATNAAIDCAEGDFIVFLDHDDEITHDCLFELTKCINEENPDFIYSDEDKIDPEGNYTQPHFKPDWSPDTMMSTMYTCHVSCVKTDLAKDLGGLRSNFDGCQDWDFVLRVSELTNNISHIPKILYHWRIIPASIASDITAKPYVLNASRAVREDAILRRKHSASVEELPGYHGYFRVNYHPVNNPLISIIIPTRDNQEVLQRCVSSLIEKTEYKNFEIIIVDNGSVKPGTITYFNSIDEMDNIKVIRHDIPFNFSELNNFGVKHAKGDIFLFLNDDTEVLHSDWLQRMAGFAQLDHIGAVGAKLLYPGGKIIQHAGVLNLQNGPSHAFLRQAKDFPGYFLRNQIEYNWLIVTGACLMIERRKFNEIAGFDESFPIAYNDVDICMTLSNKGYYNIVCQSVSLIHHESISRGVDHEDNEKATRLKKDLNMLNIKHPYYFQYDPYFNRNLHPNGYNFETLQ